MATVVLQYAGAALGTFLGGPVGGMIGRAAGGIAGSIIDQRLFGSSTHHEGPRLNSINVMSSDEGAPVPVIYGRMRVAGQIIWATNFEEVATTTTQKTSAKGGPKNTSTSYSYFVSFAIGLCEGEIDAIGRVWADGKEIDVETFNPRIYVGTETQNADALISAVEGPSPAYRGLAYIVFERLPLGSFGNRIPQLAFEVIRKGNSISSAVRAMSIIPGSTEFGYDTKLVTRSASAGVTQSENAHASAERSDWSVSLDQLQSTAENLDAVSLVVAWFGNDLRCGQCQIAPGVEAVTKRTSPVSWTVNGIVRASAHQVSESAGRPAYGGTPSDASVMRAIQDIHARGLKVMFYPFILMDIPAGNALPDPYGGTQQGNYPWRGRMTSSIAPGRVGTPDKTPTVASEITNFVGVAQPAHFTAAGETVNYSGPAEWSFRRMILHYAKLCAAAGGVDAFLIGSELVGLTTLRASASTYPFVNALQTLAAEVKTILPSAKISYAADWSEYSGHRPQDGSNDLYFHLDPLWSSSSVDFIGVDNYLPLSDWRDGTAHMDYLSGTRSIYDQSYLQSRMASGENYDWFYASQSNRDLQQRTTISDGAYNKPWVFRAKDFKNWWSNPHFNRNAGVESAIATAWQPQSKPIWFTEAGCAAIDKGCNAPSAFYDAKSVESSAPYYSGGQQDEQMQNAYLRAMQNYWQSGPTQNPISNIYGGPMLDTARIFYWAWDARPFPAFPALTSVWGDAENYARGHWLNGRLGAVDLADLITAICARFGFYDVDVAGVEGLVDGFVIDRPLSARDALENLLQIFAIYAVESDGKLKFRTRRTLSDIPLSTADLIEESATSAIFSQTRAQETELPNAVRLGYVEAALNYRTAAVHQRKSGTGSNREINLTLPAAVSQSSAQARVDVTLEEAWAARTIAQFILPPQMASIEAGDVLRVGVDRWRVKSIADGNARKIEAVAYDASVYDPPPARGRLNSATIPAIFGKPDAMTMDLALLSTDASPAPWLAAQATPWPGSLALYKKTGASSFALNRTLTKQATMATTLNAFPSGLPHRIDNTFTLDVLMRYGAFTSISKDELLNGGNLAAIGDASGYEVVQFQTAELIATNTYRLSGFLRGQGGSESEMVASRASGQNLILLNSAVVQPDLTLAASTLATTWRLGPAQLDHGHNAFLEFTYAGNLAALRPLRPTRLKILTDAMGVNISWLRRTRVDGDSWDLNEVPLGEDTELYKLDILDGSILRRSVFMPSPSYFYSTADIITDFGTMPTALTLRVAQLSAAYGLGTILERTLNV
jgi:GTA TIM-barrel-like domain/Putative phage tail protein